MKLSTSLTLALGLFLAGFFQHSASAALIFSWKQTGSDVTTRVTGEIDAAAWGGIYETRLTNTDLPLDGGFGTIFPGFGAGPFLRYGAAGVNIDTYYVETYFANPSISAITGSLVSEGGVVQAGSTPYLILELNNTPSFPYIWLDVPQGTTTIDTTVVWSNKLLSDFFTNGDAPQSQIFNSSNQLLITLEIGDFAPVPVPEPGQVAASLLLLVGIGGYVFLKRRKAAKPALVPSVA
jgi:hypothetical protein